MKICLITPKDYEVTKFEFLGQYGKNLHIPLNISESTGPIFSKFVEFVDICVGMIRLSFVLQSSKGRCCGNQLIFWGCSQTLFLTPSLFALVCKNLANCGSITRSLKDEAG